MRGARLAGWVGGLLCVLGLVAPVAACLWDYDTLPMERTRFPTALELITGKFLRHSPEFYEWRIQDRAEKLKANPDQLALYDDLAVAYNKRGQHQQAIETMLAKDKLKPGLYETYANLGAFYIYTGELEKSRDAIAKAIEINPNAHFGREVYQKHLVEYVLAKRVDGQVKLPLSHERSGSFEGDPVGFAAHLKEATDPSQGSDPGTDRERRHAVWQAEHQKAIHGVLGMMRFADHQHPVLLEALGDLLLSNGQQGDAKQLASRAYLMASYALKTQNPQAADGYHKLANLARSMQMVNGNQVTIEGIEAQLAREVAEAQSWYDSVRKQELAWIKAGKDADAEFTQAYYAEPPEIGAGGSGSLVALGVGITLAALLVGIALTGLVWRRAASTV